MASRTVRGVRQQMPPNSLVGRLSGSGAAQVVSLQDIASALQSTGLVSAPSAPGSAPGGATVVAGSGISVSVSGSAYTVTNTGVRSAVAGTGIGVSGATGAVTFSNTGVTSNVAGSGISVSGATGAVTIGNTGVTSAAAGTGIAVSNSTGGVTFSLGNMAAHTFKGNNTGSTGAPLDLTATQLTAELNALVGDSGSGGTKGLAPAPASGDAAAGKFLKADGTYAVPAGTTTVSAGTGISVSGSGAYTVSLANMAAHTFKGNNTGSTGAPLDLTATQLTAELIAMIGDSGSGGTKGLVPAAPSGSAAAGQFLKADGTFAVPSSGLPAAGLPGQFLETGSPNTWAFPSDTWKDVCLAVATSALPACTYSNGTSGTGATLTASANGALAIDAAPLVVGGRVLINGQASAFQNGIYVITQLGDASHPFILTRAIDFDGNSLTGGAVQIGNTVPVSGGTANATTIWQFSSATAGSFVFGTSSNSWTKIAGGSLSSPHTAQFNPSNPTGTTGNVMMGLGSTCTFTPTSTGVVFVTMIGQMTNTVGSVLTAARYGTGTAPTNGAALTGTVLTGLYGSGTTPATPFADAGIATLTVGTAYWFDLQLVASGGGTASIANVQVCIVELAGPVSGTAAISLNVSSPANNDLLRYDTASGQWKNTTLTAEIDSAIGSTRGSLLERGASTWGLLTPGAAGLFLKSAGAGADLSYAAVSGAGVGLFGPVMTAVPAAASLPFTTWANQGTSTITDTAVGYTLAGQLASHNDEWRLRYFTAPATPYTYTALMSVTYTGSNIGGALLGWYDGTKLQGMRLINNGGAYQIFVSSFTGLSNLFSANQVGPLVYAMTTLLWARINNDGTNITFSISSDGVNFDTIYTVAKASGALGSTGYTNVAFGVEANSRICYGTLMSWLQT